MLYLKIFNNMQCFWNYYFFPLIFQFFIFVNSLVEVALAPIFKNTSYLFDLFVFRFDALQLYRGSEVFLYFFLLLFFFSFFFLSGQSKAKSVWRKHLGLERENRDYKACTGLLSLQSNLKNQAITNLENLGNKAKNKFGTYQKVS